MWILKSSRIVLEVAGKRMAVKQEKTTLQEVRESEQGV